MKKIIFHPSFPQLLYLIIFVILFSFIIYTPTLINGPLRLTKTFIIEEEKIEGSLLFILFSLSIWIFNLYKHEVFNHKEQISKINTDKKKVEDRLNDADHYIGMVNVQIKEINSILNTIDKYPETKADFKNTFRFFGERVLAIANADWVLFRIINSSSQRTIFERIEKRLGASFDYPHVSNKMIIEKQPVFPFTSVISSPQNLNILVFCIMPVETINNEQQIFTQTIINEITKLFVILNSSYYKKGNEILIESQLPSK